LRRQAICRTRFAGPGSACHVRQPSIRIGLDAVSRLHARPRELAVVYHDSATSLCACFADGVAIATYASVGQRTLTIASEPAPEGAIAVVVIRPRAGGAGFKYTIPAAALGRLGKQKRSCYSCAAVIGAPILRRRSGRRPRAESIMRNS